VARLAPNAAVSSTHIATGKGVRMLQSWDNEPVRGGSVICDYWAGIKEEMRKEPTSFVLIRLWRTGPASPDEEQLFDDVAGSYIVGGGASFAGPLGPMMLQTHGRPPASEVAEPHRFHYAGWRLGTVYQSKMFSEQRAGLAIEGGGRPRDALLLLAVFLAGLLAFGVTTS
jgi:hypothetical protein